MARTGRSYNFRKQATLANFDGSSGAKTLFIQPGHAISGIQASLGANATPASDLFVVARVALQVFTGATPSGTGWTGGSWATYWSTTLGLSNNATALAGAGADPVFTPPMELPLASSIMTGGSHAKLGQMVPPNTHNASEVAGEWDIRVIITVIAGSGTGVDADVNVQTVAVDA